MERIKITLEVTPEQLQAISNILVGQTTSKERKEAIELPSVSEQPISKATKVKPSPKGVKMPGFGRTQAQVDSFQEQEEEKYFKKLEEEEAKAAKRKEKEEKEAKSSKEVEDIKASSSESSISIVANKPKFFQDYKL